MFLFIAYTAQTSEGLRPTAASVVHSKALAVCRGPLDHYDFLIKAQELRDDEHQRRVVQCLQKLLEDLKGYSIEEAGLFPKVRLSHLLKWIQCWKDDPKAALAWWIPVPALLMFLCLLLPSRVQTAS